MSLNMLTILPVFEVFMIPILHVSWAAHRRDSHCSCSVVLKKNRIHESSHIVGHSFALGGTKWRFLAIENELPISALIYSYSRAHTLILSNNNAGQSMPRDNTECGGES